jgi:tetratricopeptide (TPR) repeat protein
MGDLWLQLVPRSATDFALLDADINRKTLSDDLAGYAKLLESDARNPMRHDTVAMLELRAGHTDAAIDHFREAIRLDPESPPEHYNLGIALSMRQKIDEAIVEFGEAVRLDPTYPEAHNNLAGMLLLRRRYAEAVDHYRVVAAVRPDSAEAHDNLARGLVAVGMMREAIDQFAAAAELRPRWALPLAGSAWVQATSADPAIRNINQAVRLAERAAELSGKSDPTVLDTLAAAYAAAGRFDEAIRVAESAAEAATHANILPLATEIRRHVALYQQHLPLLEVP